jgi:hypothetical protein
MNPCNKLFEKGKGKPSQLYNRMHSTEMSSTFNPTPLNQRGALIEIHVFRRLWNSELTALFRGRMTDVYLVSSRIRSSNLSVTRPTLLTTRLPAAPPL